MVCKSWNFYNMEVYIFRSRFKFKNMFYKSVLKSIEMHSKWQCQPPLLKSRMKMCLFNRYDIPWQIWMIFSNESFCKLKKCYFLSLEIFVSENCIMKVKGIRWWTTRISFLDNLGLRFHTNRWIIDNPSYWFDFD